MKDKILNKIIEFCIKRVNVIYNPYIVIATVKPEETKRIIEELKRNNIYNKEDYLKWSANFKKGLDKISVS